MRGNGKADKGCLFTCCKTLETWYCINGANIKCVFCSLEIQYLDSNLHQVFQAPMVSTRESNLKKKLRQSRRIGCRGGFTGTEYVQTEKKIPSGCCSASLANHSTREYVWTGHSTTAVDTAGPHLTVGFSQGQDTFPRQTIFGTNLLAAA